MPDENGRPNHIEDVLVHLHDGAWFGWSSSKDKVYENLIIHDGSKSKPTESELTTELAAQQTAFDDAAAAQVTNRASTKTKLEALGLTVDEIKAAFGIE